jgi:hypothetical protein
LKVDVRSALVSNTVVCGKGSVGGKCGCDLVSGIVCNSLQYYWGIFAKTTDVVIVSPVGSAEMNSTWVTDSPPPHEAEASTTSR